MIVNRQELTERILAIVEDMPEPMKCVFILTHYKGFDPEQVVEKVGLQIEQIVALTRQGQRRLYGGVEQLMSVSKERSRIHNRRIGKIARTLVPRCGGNISFPGSEARVPS